MTDTVSSSLETQITGSFSTRFWLELFGNSAHFPIANILLELLVEPLDYLPTLDLYVIVTASVVQAYWLTRWQFTPRPHRFWGNLIGPAFYTFIEGLAEGLHFFSAPYHLAYWGFALATGVLQASRLKLPAHFRAPIIVLENVIRTAILFFMYAIFEIYANPAQTSSLNAFFKDTSHQFIGLAVLFLGIIVGLANLTADRYLSLLRQISAQLKVYSEWLLGRDLLSKAIFTPSTLNLARRERAILFMDIRGFTRWSESRSPEVVVNLLNQYYQLAEAILARYPTIKFKLTADEVLAVFPEVNVAVRAALELCVRVNGALLNHGIGVGIGVHVGPVVEGLLGSAQVKFYDVIGDTVNMTQRIENAARVGEVLISESTRKMMGQAFHVGKEREIVVKGKMNSLLVYSLPGQNLVELSNETS
ncbi:MAG: adenylate/guanylate cyclase domain-containing protein [Anaerolineales bacterium]